MGVGQITIASTKNLYDFFHEFFTKKTGNFAKKYPKKKRLFEWLSKRIITAISAISPFFRIKTIKRIAVFTETLQTFCKFFINSK